MVRLCSKSPSRALHHSVFLSWAGYTLDNLCGVLNSSLVWPAKSDASLQSETIAVRRLDEIVPQTSQVSFIKIDTEGFEPLVLEGASKLIERCRPTICLELSHEHANSSEQAIVWLQDKGYRFDTLPDLSVQGMVDNFYAVPV